MRRHSIVLPLAALLAVSPLLLFGTSCGHDLGFHMQSWVDAAAQFRQGAVYPRWAYTPAWQAGEPRFVFYPPLSWVFGALLTLALPMPATPNVFIFCALLAAGFSMHAVARRFTSNDGALVAACVYLANPYMLFNAFERSALAELLASVWIPLLFLAVLRRRPSAIITAFGVGLAWLTNVPSGIMATYTFVALAACRMLFGWHGERRRQSTMAAQADDLPRCEMRVSLRRADMTESTLPPAPPYTPELGRNALRLGTGLLLGLALPGVYLVPAAVERRWVQSSMVMIENLRYQDNYLFHRTSWEPHNVVTRTVSELAVAMLLLTAGFLSTRFLGRRRFSPESRRAWFAIAIVFGFILFLLLPVSGFIWHIAPELPFLQFPWRLLTILSAVLALAVALALRYWQAPAWLAPVVALAWVGMVTGICSHLYRQACEIPHMAQYTIDVFRAGHGVAATDEYTPGDADNDVLRTDSPGYWLEPLDTPDGYAAGTVPNPNETDPLFDGPIPYRDTKAEHAPSHLDLTVSSPEVLVLNLRDYPDWHISRNGALVPQHVHRDDGLVALELPAGHSLVDVSWHRGWDAYTGDALSVLALLGLAYTAWRSARMRRVESTVPAS